MSKVNNTLFAKNWETPELLKTKYIPSLDGWRAIAVIMVIIAHFRFTIDENNLTYKIIENLTLGIIGVKIFFVLSGFLITTLLIKETIKFGKVNIKNFFIRRILRIIPVIYFYLLVIYLINNYLNLGLTYKDFIPPILFITNFGFTNVNWLVGHTWTLSIEEQFYLIWPFIFYKLKNLQLFLILILIIIPIIKVIDYLSPNLSYFLLGPFFVHGSSIIIGSFISFLLFFQKISKYITNQLNYKFIYFIISILILFTTSYYMHKGMFGVILLPFGNLITDLCLTYILLYSLILNNNYLYKFLNNRVIKHIGLISFSLYVWQQLVLIPNDQLPILKNYLNFPVNLLLLLILSYISYYLIEKPIKKLRNKFAI